MKALRLIDWKTDPELVEVPKPTPGPGQVIVEIGGAGACHSDLHLMHDFEPGMMPWKLPFTLGHENAGWVDSIGDGVTAVSEGDAVAVYGAWGCGTCSRCQQGFENYCENPAEAPVVSGGGDCSAIHPMAVGSPFLTGLDLHRYGLSWRLPDIDCVHPPAQPATGPGVDEPNNPESLRAFKASPGNRERSSTSPAYSTISFTNPAAPRATLLCSSAASRHPTTDYQPVRHFGPLTVNGQPHSRHRHPNRPSGKR